MTRFLPTVAILGATLLTGGLFSPAAYADSVTEQVTMTFDVSDLNSADSADRVLTTLTRQAREVCTVSQPILNRETVDDACVADVLEQAVAQIDSANLNKVYSQSIGVEPTQQLLAQN